MRKLKHLKTFEGMDEHSVVNERIDFKEISKALTTLKTKKEIDKWVENFLSVADDYDFAQQELLSYVIEMEFDDEELRLLWMDVIQSY